MNLQKKSLEFIENYQKNISPKKPACCKYTPSCSEYTRQSISKYGFFKGWLLGAYRILRCNSFSKGGQDLLK